MCVKRDTWHPSIFPKIINSFDSDLKSVRESIVDIMEDEDHDDGSFGPLFVRLAWHAAGME